MKQFFKIIAMIFAILILSAVSAYALYILLLLTGIVSYYELSPTTENVQSDIALIVSFFSFVIAYSIIARNIIFKKNIDNEKK